LNDLTIDRHDLIKLFKSSKIVPRILADYFPCFGFLIWMV
jgi:hypothetical protein